MRYQKSVYRSLVLVSQFGINMLVPIFLCFLLGMYIDKKLDTSFAVVIFFFIGALAGFRNVYIFARKIYGQKGKAPEYDERKKKD